jgi:hypothetical protein
MSINLSVFERNPECEQYYLPTLYCVHTDTSLNNPPKKDFPTLYCVHTDTSLNNRRKRTIFWNVTPCAPVPKERSGIFVKAPEANSYSLTETAVEDLRSHTQRVFREV